MQLQNVRQAQFVGQSEDGVVAGEEVMIEVLQRPIPFGATSKAGRQPAQFRAGLVDRDPWTIVVRCSAPSSVEPSRVKIVGGCQPGDPAADDGDLLLMGRLGLQVLRHDSLLSIQVCQSVVTKNQCQAALVWPV